MMLAYPLQHLKTGRARGWTVGEFNVYELMGEVEDAIRSSVETRIRLFGSEGKGV